MSDLIKSPLNYTGGKFKLLPQILPLLPEDINTFIDLFGGGANLSVNINANKIIYNELSFPIVDLFENIYCINTDEILLKVNAILKENIYLKTKEDFFKLRNDYNNNKCWDKLFVLSCYSFNYAIRFNKKGDFNTPSGVNKSRFSELVKNRLIDFSNKIKSKNIVFSNKDFKLFDFSSLKENDFVYVDPPYLISSVYYNSGWGRDNELILLNLLDELDRRGITFALSNVTVHKGQTNDILINWANKYYVHKINVNYNYNWAGSKKEEFKNSETVEVLITNYKK